MCLLMNSLVKVSCMFHACWLVFHLHVRVQSRGTFQQPAGLSAAAVVWDLWNGKFRVPEQDVESLLQRTAPPPHTTELSRGCMNPHQEKVATSGNLFVSVYFPVNRFQERVYPTRVSRLKRVSYFLLSLYIASLLCKFVLQQSCCLFRVSCRRSFPQTSLLGLNFSQKNIYLENQAKLSALYLIRVAVLHLLQVV